MLTPGGDTNGPANMPPRSQVQVETSSLTRVSQACNVLSCPQLKLASSLFYILSLGNPALPPSSSWPLCLTTTLSGFPQNSQYSNNTHHCLWYRSPSNKQAFVSPKRQPLSLSAARLDAASTHIATNPSLMIHITTTSVASDASSPLLSGYQTIGSHLHHGLLLTC